LNYQLKTHSTKIFNTLSIVYKNKKKYNKLFKENQKIKVINIKKDKDEKNNMNKNHRAEEIAKIMVENMKANMENPNFWLEKEARQQKAADKVLKRRKERQKKKDKLL